MSTLLVRCAIGASLLAGCGRPPMPKLVPKHLLEFEHASTGEALQVTGETKRYTATEDQVVGGKRCYDAYGRSYTCSESFRTVEVERSKRIVKVFQGRAEIDPLSALRIANDPAFQAAYAERVAEVERDRARMPQVYREGMSGTGTKKVLGAGLVIASSGVSLVGMAFVGNEKYQTVMGAALLGSSLMLLGGIYLWKGASEQQESTATEARRLAGSRVSRESFAKYTSEDHLREAAERYNRTLTAAAPAAAPAATPVATSTTTRAWTVSPLSLVDARGSTILEVDREGYVVRQGRRDWQFSGDRYGTRYRFAPTSAGVAVYDGTSRVMMIDRSGTATSVQGFSLKVLPTGAVELSERGRVTRSQARFRGVTETNRSLAAFLATQNLMRLALR